jgi:predicted membrane channel-forming protein YqfA (hemolysin III family)
MVEETMAEQKFCQGCNQKDECQKVYQQLGNVKGPSVVSKVIVAFLLPVVVFIVSLAVFERIFTRVVNAKELQTVLSFLMAMLMTFICILIVQAINRQLR